MKQSMLFKICSIVVMVFAVNLIIGSTTFAAKPDVETKIDINEATVKEFAKLPGIGKKKAEAIVVYRTEIGKFKSVDDLKKVEGIGKKTFEKIKGHLTVEGS